MDCALETYILPTVHKNNQQEFCGAFYNLARVIGKGENRGVPETDSNLKEEKTEWLFARIRMEQCKEKVEYISKEEMFLEVDTFLIKFRHEYN